MSVWVEIHCDVRSEAKGCPQATGNYPGAMVVNASSVPAALRGLWKVAVREGWRRLGQSRIACPACVEVERGRIRQQLLAERDVRRVVFIGRHDIAAGAAHARGIELRHVSSPEALLSFSPDEFRVVQVFGAAPELVTLAVERGMMT